MWKDYEQIKKTTTVYIAAVTWKKTGQLGTGFIVKKEIGRNILGFEPYNDRICKLRLKGNYHNLSLICVHGPVEDSDTDIKEQFFENLQIVHDRTPKHDVTTILGDMNAKVGTEATYQPVTDL
jgi:hypothetical protein